MCQCGLHFSSRASPSEHKLDVNLHQLQKHAHSEMNRSQDLVLHFHSSLIESPLKPNQQLCSSLVSEVLSYPRGLGNGGQWVCYCFSLPLYPHIYVMSTVKWQRKLQTGVSDRRGEGQEKKNIEEITAFMIFVCFHSQKGDNCSGGHGCTPVWRMEQGKYHLSPANRSSWNNREVLKIQSLDCTQLLLSHRKCSLHCTQTHKLCWWVFLWELVLLHHPRLSIHCLYVLIAACLPTETAEAAENCQQWWRQWWF